MTPEKQEIREKFLIDSKAERKALAQKNAEMRAIMKADAPDPLKASEVAGELFELREKLRLKALEAKLPLPVLMMGQDYHGMEYQDHGLMNPKK
jgi:zinc resistance-associated protein